MKTLEKKWIKKEKNIDGKVNEKNPLSVCTWATKMKSMNGQKRLRWIERSKKEHAEKTTKRDENGNEVGERKEKISERLKNGRENQHLLKSTRRRHENDETEWTVDKKHMNWLHWCDTRKTESNEWDMQTQRQKTLWKKYVEESQKEKRFIDLCWNSIFIPPRQSSVRWLWPTVCLPPADYVLQKHFYCDFSFHFDQLYFSSPLASAQNEIKRLTRWEGEEKSANAKEQFQLITLNSLHQWEVLRILFSY